MIFRPAPIIPMSKDAGIMGADLEVIHQCCVLDVKVGDFDQRVK
jgi:hypothetical protein